MKKLAILSLFVLAFAAAPALAEERPLGSAPMFEKHDTNKDGAISKEEYMKSLEEYFVKMDTDGNGSISKNEAQAVRKKWAEKHKDRMQSRQNAVEDTVVETPAEAPAQ